MTTATILLLVLALSAVFSRGLRRGMTVTINETLFEGLAGKKDTFHSILEQELSRRGILLRKPLEKDTDFIYRDFFNEVRIYLQPVGTHLRYGYKISTTKAALTLGIILLVPFVVGAVIVFILALLRHNNLRDSLREAAESAALLCRA